MLNVYSGYIFRILGFLFGFSLASAFASYHLLEEYRLASAILQSSVQVGFDIMTSYSMLTMVSSTGTTNKHAKGVGACTTDRDCRKGVKGTCGTNC